MDLNVVFRTKSEEAGLRALMDSTDKEIGKLKALQAAGIATEKQLARLSELLKQQSALAAIAPPIPPVTEENDPFQGKHGLIKGLKALKHELHGVPGLWEASMLLKGGSAGGLIAASIGIGAMISAIVKAREELKEWDKLNRALASGGGLDIHMRQIDTASRGAQEAFSRSMEKIREEVANTYASLDRDFAKIQQRLKDAEAIIQARVKAETAEAKLRGAGPRELGAIEEAGAVETLSKQRQAREEEMEAAKKQAAQKSLDAAAAATAQASKQREVDDLAKKQKETRRGAEAADAKLKKLQKDYDTEGMSEEEIKAEIERLKKLPATPGAIPFLTQQKIKGLQNVLAGFGLAESRENEAERIKNLQAAEEEKLADLRKKANEAKRDSEKADQELRRIQEREPQQRNVEDVERSSRQRQREAEIRMELNRPVNTPSGGGIYGEPLSGISNEVGERIVARLDTLVSHFERNA